MPVFRIGEKLCYFAHVPKCGGSSVEAYLRARFGPVGFLDTGHLWRDEPKRWSRTSPQHVDWASLQSLLPEAMIDAVFAVVRHPVARIVSAYHHQVEVEGAAGPGISFAEWLAAVVSRRGDEPFAYDNHVRPQVDFMPGDCTIFHLEHGLDAIVPYLDSVAGAADGPRTIGHANRRDARGRSETRGEPGLGSAELAMIREHYSRDFERFGYEIGRPEPLAPRSALSAEYIAARDAELARKSRLINRTTKRIWRGIARRLG